MTITNQGIIDEVWMISSEGTGKYLMLISQGGNVDFEYVSGACAYWFPERARWRRDYWLLFLKKGWLRCQFKVIHKLFGHESFLVTSKDFGTRLLFLIQTQQAGAVTETLEEEEEFEEEEAPPPQPPPLRPSPSPAPKPKPKTELSPINWGEENEGLPKLGPLPPRPPRYEDNPMSPRNRLFLFIAIAGIAMWILILI